MPLAETGTLQQNPFPRLINIAGLAQDVDIINNDNAVTDN